MNAKLLASFAVFVLLTAIVSISLTGSALAAEPKDEMKAKKDAAKKDMKAKKDAMKKEMKATKEAAKKDMKAKKDAAKKDMKATKDAMKKEMKATKTTASGSAAKEVTVDMAKGTASDTNCGEKCYMPSTVSVSVGGKVTWKNADSAAHTATATDSSFDTSLVNAGTSASNTFNTAGSYPYMCILHPWMKGTVNVQ